MYVSAKKYMNTYIHTKKYTTTYLMIKNSNRENAMKCIAGTLHKYVSLWCEKFSKNVCGIFVIIKVKI